MLRAGWLLLALGLAGPAQAQVIGVEKKKSNTRCESYERQLEDLRKNERRGGSAKQMDSYNERRRSIEAARAKAGC